MNHYESSFQSWRLSIHTILHRWDDSYRKHISANQPFTSFGPRKFVLSRRTIAELVDIVQWSATNSDYRTVSSIYRRSSVVGLSKLTASPSKSYKIPSYGNAVVSFKDFAIHSYHELPCETSNKISRRTINSKSKSTLNPTSRLLNHARFCGSRLKQPLVYENFERVCTRTKQDLEVEYRKDAFCTNGYEAIVRLVQVFEETLCTGFF
uniref:Uncharacterized protein n=1 Tax=Romanomermis culicivorax TaxID=13658 RepID=A0A915J5C1_ROMCU